MIINITNVTRKELITIAHWTPYVRDRYSQQHPSPQRLKLGVLPQIVQFRPNQYACNLL
jgi:hypothetical protein